MESNLKIAFFGSSLVSAYWNGAATYYRGLLSELHRLGHSLTFYEPDAYERQEHRDIDDPPYARVQVYSAGDDRGIAAALADAAAADVIVKFSGVGVFDEFLERAVLDFQDQEKTVIFWDVDAPATLDRVGNNPRDHFRALIPRYELILTYGGGDPVVKAYESLGARRCVPIYNALDPSVHYPVEPDARYKAALSFMGNRMPDREQRVLEFFFRAAELHPDREFILGGNGWQENAPRLANVKILGHVFTADHNAMNSSPLAVLNISRESMARYGFSPATRVFEAAGSGACIITDAWEGIETFLSPDREVLVARNGDEVATHLRALTPSRARQIGQAARARVLAEHTYARRARIVHDLLLQARESRLERVH